MVLGGCELEKQPDESIELEKRMLEKALGQLFNECKVPKTREVSEEELFRRVMRRR